MRPCIGRAAIVKASLHSACACLALTLLVGCGDAQPAASSSPADATPASVSSSPLAASPAWPGPNDDLSTSLDVLRGGLKTAYASGRDGAPWQAAPPSVIGALRRYFATVDPGKFNGADRVGFVWAFTVPREPDGRRSTATEQYVDAYFFADGGEMVAAGSIAPGFSVHLMRLSRPSADEAWQVDGLYSP